MPRYTYICPDCTTTVEASLPVEKRDASAPLCECGKTMTRVPAAPGIAFRGPGWTPKGR